MPRLGMASVWVILGVVFLGFGFLHGPLRTEDEGHPVALTPFPTPTPLPDGRIIYVVQPGDTIWRIAAIARISVEELRALNNLEGDDLTPGQSLLLGYAVPGFPTPTPGPSPTPSPVLPTPTKVPGFGTLCVFLYEDRNGNGMFDEDEEGYLAGGSVSIQDPRGQVTQTAVTHGDEEVCFEDIPVGQYQVSMGIPQGFNPTTQTNLTVKVLAGNIVYVSFGAQASEEAAGSPLTPGAGGQGPAWMGLLGLVFVIVGGVLFWFAARLRRE